MDALFVLSASYSLTAAACSLISLQMAQELLRRRADLSSDVSITFHLVGAGFGLPTIQKLRRMAASDALKIKDRRGMN